MKQQGSREPTRCEASWKGGVLIAKKAKKVLTDRAKADIILRHLKSGIIISYHNISFKRFEGKKKIKKC